MINKEKIEVEKIYQKIDKSTKLSIVVREGFNEITLNKLKKEITQRIGNIPFVVEFVDEIHRDPLTGKIRCVITEIK